MELIEVILNRKSKTGTYSIKELEILTGIKAHTIRIWEQRYNILEPVRTNTNIRTYSDEDLKHLLNISLLNKNGVKISKLAKMGKDDIKERVLGIYEKEPTHHDQIEALIMVMMDFDEEKFNHILEINIEKLGFEEAFTKVVFPFLQRLGLLWQTNVIQIAQEHFVTSMVRQKIIAAIDRLKVRKHEYTKKCMLFLPEGEMHEISLLFIKYLLRARNHYTLYLGASIPFQDVVSSYADVSPDHLFSVITTYPPDDEVVEYVTKLCSQIKTTPLILTGKRILGVREKLPNNVKVMFSIEDIIEHIDGFKK